MHACMHGYIQTHVQAHTTHMNIYTNKYIDTYIHTYTHMCMYVLYACIHANIQVLLPSVWHVSWSGRAPKIRQSWIAAPGTAAGKACASYTVRGNACASYTVRGNACASCTIEVFIQVILHTSCRPRGMVHIVSSSGSRVCFRCHEIYLVQSSCMYILSRCHAILVSFILISLCIPLFSWNVCSEMRIYLGILSQSRNHACCKPPLTVYSTRPWRSKGLVQASAFPNCRKPQRIQHAQPSA
jgi:hypothetical protein